MAEKVRHPIAAPEQQKFDPAMVVGERPLSEGSIWAKDRISPFDPVERGIAEVFDALSKVTDWTYRK